MSELMGAGTVATDDWCAEHLVPQSWHRGSATHPGTDMHQVFIVSKTANGSRGNAIFGLRDTDPSLSTRSPAGTFEGPHDCDDEPSQLYGDSDLWAALPTV